jgi:hypothetical protein
MIQRKVVSKAFGVLSFLSLFPILFVLFDPSGAPGQEGGGAWVFKKKWIEENLKPVHRTKHNWEISDERFSMSGYRPADPQRVDPGVNFRDLVTWDPLPARIVPEAYSHTKFSFDGSFKDASGKARSRMLSCYVYRLTEQELQDFLLRGSIKYSTFFKDEDVYTYDLEFRYVGCPQNPSDTTMYLVVEIRGDFLNEGETGLNVRYFYQYTWEPAPASDTPQSRSPKTDSLKLDKNAPDWYYHAQKGYRFIKTQGWSVEFSRPDSDTDLLLPPDESLGLMCGRSSGSAGSESAERVLDRLAAGIAQKNPSATTSRFTLGNSPAIRIDTFDGDKKSMMWHFYVLHGGRTYYLAVMMPPGTERALLPDQVMAMLRTLEFLE